MTLSDVDNTKMHHVLKRSGRDVNGWKKRLVKGINDKKKVPLICLHGLLKPWRGIRPIAAALFKAAVKHRLSVDKPIPKI